MLHISFDCYNTLNGLWSAQTHHEISNKTCFIFRNVPYCTSSTFRKWILGDVGKQPFGVSFLNLKIGVNLWRSYKRIVLN